jgi:superfamily I DNA/RNA helicase
MPRKPQPVGERVIKNYNFLKRLVSTRSEKKRCQLLSEASADQLLAIVESASNILNWKYRLNNRQRNKLKPFAHTVRRLARARSEKGARRIVQTGGSLALIGTLLGPILADAAFHLIHKFTNADDT